MTNKQLIYVLVIDLNQVISYNLKTMENTNENTIDNEPPVIQQSDLSERMRTQPIGKLLASMSLPAIFSMLVLALYNVIDTLFISSYSERVYGANYGTTALSAAYPIQMLLIAFAVGIGIGTNVVIAHKLGEGNKASANRIATTGVFMSIVCSLIFSVLAFFISKPFIALFSGGNEIVMQMGTQYITICMALCCGLFVEITLAKILQATGSVKIPMISQLIGACINIVLDPLLINGIGFFPELGIVGAAVATVTGQICAMIFVIIMFVVRTHEVKVDFKGFIPRKHNMLAICVIGFPVMVMNAVAGFTVSLLNIALVSYANGIAILGIYFKMQSFVFMPVYGVTQGLMPILSYNYASNNKERYVKTLRLAIIVALIIMMLGLLLFMIGAEWLMRMFSASGDYLTDGAFALRIMSLAFVPAAFGITMTTGVQAIGKGITSLCLSMLRQVVLLIPLAFILAGIFGMHGTWWSYPISEIVTIIVFIPILVVSVNKKFALLNKDSSVEQPIKQS